MKTKMGEIEKHIIENYYKKALKIFSRFLKEEGKYVFIMRYLFPPGRDIDYFKKILFEDGAKSILDTYDSLGPSFKKFGREHYMQKILPIRNKWVEFYKENCF